MKYSPSFSGGEIPAGQKETFFVLRKLLHAADDVLRVVHLAPFDTDATRWIYLIETPFATFPRFVVGTCAPDGSECRIEYHHVSEQGAVASFEQFIP